MRGIKLSNLIVLVAGLVLCLLGIALLLYDGSRERGLTIDALPQTPAEFIAAGEALIKKHNCNFCHVTEPPQDHPPDRANCQQCHQLEGRPEFIAPPLAHVAERRTEEFIRRYLRYPYAIRTQGHFRMPDLLLSDLEIHVLTGYLLEAARERSAQLPQHQPRRETQPDPRRLQAGRALWERYACSACHSLGEEIVEPVYGPGGVPLMPAIVFAPPLDDAWQRTKPQWIVAAIREPEKWLPYAGMTVAEISEQDAIELAWYVMNAVPSPPQTVSFHAVQQILQADCASSCHYGPREDASPATNPEGGAGWLATWSEHPRRLDLLSFEGLMRGADDDLGNPRPSVVPYAPNSPLLAHIEGWKQPRMPFGANPLQPNDIETIRNWILQGAPAPNQ
jgi:cytochrome c2